MIVRIAAVIWTILVIVLSLMPKAALDEAGLIQLMHLDKLGHFTFYFGFVYLWSKAFNDSRNFRNKQLWIVLISIFLGITIEYLQMQTNFGRHFEYLDIIANIMGSMVALITYNKINKT